MPTYEYRCPEGHEFERFQKMTDPPRARCPVCGKSAVRQISGGAGLIFKGSGFYITDYGKDGKGPRQDPRQDKESDAKPESAKSESAPPAEAAKPAKPDAASKSDKPDKKSGKKKASS